MNKIVVRFLHSMGMAIIAIIITIIIAFSPDIKEGLELLFLLPLSMAFISIIYGDIISKWKTSIGFVIILASCLLRYIISPLLMCLTQHTVIYINASASSYRWAVIAMIIELFLFFAILKYFDRRYERRYKIESLTDDSQNEKAEFKVTWMGWCACLLIIIVLIRRGHLDNVFSHFSFLTNYSIDNSDIYTYDRTFVYLVKSFVFIAIVAKLKKVSEKYKSLRTACIIIAIVAAFGNVVLYDHTSRSVLVEIIVSSVAVLIYCFPEKRKAFITVFGIGGFALVSSVFLIGTLQTTWATIGHSSDFIERLSEISELYSNGVSTMAHAIETLPLVKGSVGINTLFSGIINSIGFITFPGFRSVYYLTKNTPTAASLFLSSLRGKGFILPPFGIALYYGDVVFAIPISVLNMVICTIFLYWVRSKKKKNDYNAGMVYVITYAEIICGMSFFINNISIMISSLTQIPLLLLLLLKINELGKRVVIKRK